MYLLSKLHKNSVLTGPVESYCLACGCVLRSEEESYAHIHNQDHVDKLEALLRLENYKKDCIIKSKEGYFCPFCNIIMPTVKKVSLHVTELKHKDNKNSQSITRHAGVIFAFDDVVINDRSWNGLVDATCFVCNEDYDDEEDHKKAAKHLLNLINIKCEFGDTFIYRKVDIDLFFCLICNDVYPISEKQTHHETKKHLELYDKSKAKGISIRNNTASIDTKEVIGPNNNTVSIPEKSVQITQNSTENKTNIDNIKPKVNETVAQNGTAHIDDHKNSTIPKTDQNTPNLNTPEVKLEKNTQEPAKLKTDNTTPVLRLNTPNKSTQETIKTNTAKVSEGNDRSKNETPKLNTETVQTHNGLEAQKINSQETAKLNTEKTKELTDTPKKTLNTDSAGKNTEPMVSEAVHAVHDEELHCYNYLKACNFMVSVNNSAVCFLCCTTIPNNADNLQHCIENHHCVMYEKEVALQNLFLK